MLQFLGNFTLSCEVGTVFLCTKHNVLFFESSHDYMHCSFSLVWSSDRLNWSLFEHLSTAFLQTHWSKLQNGTIYCFSCCLYSCRLWFLKCLSHGWMLPATIHSFHGVWCAICSKEPSGVHMRTSWIWKQF